MPLCLTTFSFFKWDFGPYVLPFQLPCSLDRHGLGHVVRDLRSMQGAGCAYWEGTAQSSPLGPWGPTNVIMHDPTTPASNTALRQEHMARPLTTDIPSKACLHPGYQLLRCEKVTEPVRRKPH